ncbi:MULTISPECIES: sensor histidine kinase [Halobacteriovorax]|nr:MULTISPECIES: HAMP domain-containing sensor histidine kinase [Halobacteriovorax]
MFSPQSQIKDSLFYQSTNIAISPNLIGNLVGGSAALCVFYVSFVIWREISKRNLEEYLLRIGVIFNILVVLNDTFISLEVSGSLIPIYYFANAFEALRFNLHFLKKAHSKMYNLESEVVHLSKVAQFGYAAASIAHDIKNHVFVMKVKVDKLIKGRYSTTDKVYEDLKKYNEGILEITDLYMNIFKNNISSQKEELDFNEILKDVRGLILPKFENTNVRFLEETKNFKIFCNKAEMVICLVNLIKNSLEEVKEKKDNPWVLLKSDIEKNKILVVDSGDGIDQKQAEQIFKFGYTGKKSGGHGVGLAITNELLQRSGFSLKLEKGCKNTTFSINC